MRVVYVTASSGGGHHAVAKAMTAIGGFAFGDAIEQETVDFYGGGALQSLPFLSRIRYHSDPLWRAIYGATDRPWMVRPIAAALRPLGVRHLRKQITGAPGALVAVHFGAAQCLEPLARSYRVRPKTAVIVTDYEAHWAWFARADMYIVASESAEARALRAGIPRERVLRVPILPSVRPRALASRRRTHDGRLRVIAVAGSDGTSEARLVRLLRRLEAGSAASQIVIDAVCGRGEGLRAALTELASTFRRLEVRVHGYVNDLPERFAASDVALLRAGGASITEALAAAAPVVAFDWHVHEASNARVPEQLGCGRAEKDPEKGAAALEALATRSGLLHEWRRAARAVADRAPARDFAEHFFGGLGASRHEVSEGP